MLPLLGKAAELGLEEETLFVDSFEAFTDRGNAWLREKAKAEKPPSRNAFMRCNVPDWPGQMSLAADLLAIEREPAKHPALRDVVMEQCSLNDCPSRLEWLGKTDVGTLTAHAVNFMRENVARLIPSPEAMSGDYASAAGWRTGPRLRHRAAPGPDCLMSIWHDDILLSLWSERRSSCRMSCMPRSSASPVSVRCRSRR